MQNNEKVLTPNWGIDVTIRTESLRPEDRILVEVKSPSVVSGITTGTREMTLNDISDVICHHGEWHDNAIANKWHVKENSWRSKKQEMYNEVTRLVQFLNAVQDGLKKDILERYPDLYREMFEQVPQLVVNNRPGEADKPRKIVRNQGICPDGTVLVSRFTHDFRSHVCAKTGLECFIDGGTSYVRAGGPITLKTLYADDPHTTLREHLDWGTYGIDGKKKLHYKRICELETSHIENILQNVTRLDPFWRAFFAEELQYRIDNPDKCGCVNPNPVSF